MDPDLGGRWGVIALAALAVIAVVTVAGATATDAEPSGADVLDDMRDRYANAETVVGSADVRVSNGSANTTAVVEYAVAGNKSRVAVTRGDDTYRAGSNGSVVWYVAPNGTGAWDLDALRRGKRAANHSVPNGTLSDGVDVERVGPGSDGGTPAHVLRVTPANESRDGRATLWIAKNDSRLLRVEATDGTNTTVIDYRDTRFNVSVHASTFEPPSDRLAVTSFERYDDFASVQANTSIDLPRLDATFREAGVFQGTGGTDVAQRYRADGDTVTVVSTTRDRFDRLDADATRVTVNGHDANVTTVRGAAVVYWRDDGVTTAVVLEGSEDRALELARRLK